MPTLEYIFSIQDQASDKLQRITAASQPLINAVITVQDKMAAAEMLINETGGSITALKAQVDALSAERDLLPAEGLGIIAQYNDRIGKLQQKIEDLQTRKPKPVMVPYTFSLNDCVSGGLRKIDTESDHVRAAMDGVGKQLRDADALMAATGRSAGSLHAKIAALRAEREWIPADNIEAIRVYDREIKSLADEIERIENMTGGQSKLGQWTSEIANSIPGIGLLKNPVVQAGAAIIGTAKSAMAFDQNMAQVNITTLLEGEELENLRKRIKGVADEFGADASTVPLAFDLINSQINDADKSMNVLAASIKGSKAGFTDVNTVASALAQTVSLLGDVDASEVLDTFFASKRMGAVDFSSLAQYLPNLLSLGNGMGIDYKEIAGTFSYLTGKGQSADQATVMLSNAMSVLGKGDVREKMAKAGVKVFDEQGKMRGMTDIFGDLGSLMNGRSDEDRSQILESFGIVDKEAKGAFNVLISDLEKYRSILDGVQDATKNEEGNKALAASKNTVQDAEDAWNRFKNVGLSVGETMLPIISSGIETFSTLMQGLSPVVEVLAPVISGALSGVESVLYGVTLAVRTLIEFFGGWMEYLQEGQPLVVGLTAALVSLGAVWAANLAIAKADIMWQTARNSITAVSTAVTEGWATAQALLNASFLACPLTWVIAIVAGVAAAVYTAWQKFESFRVVVLGTWSVVKEFGRSLVNAIITPINQILKGLGGIGEAIGLLFKGSFSDAAEIARQGFKDIGKGIVYASPAGVAVNTWNGGDYSQAWENGKQEGQRSWALSQAETNAPIGMLPEELESSAKIPESSAPAVSTEELLKLLGKGDKSNKARIAPTARPLDLNDEATNYAQSSSYLSATQKLAPLTSRLIPAGGIAAAVMLPMAVSLANPITSADDSALAHTISVHPDDAVPLPTASEVLSDATDMSKTDSNQSQVYDKGITQNTGRSERDFTIDRVCNQIVINVENTDGLGLDVIRGRILEVLNEIVEG